jgi:antitoxin (DNA-binding transcriptional repressor) of toxin-antitoxin stability system
MATHEPSTRSIDVKDVQHALPEMLPSISRKGGRVVIEKDGVAVAAIVSIQDLRNLARFDAERDEHFKVFERIAAAFAHEDPEESERLAALALAEAREDMRRERAAKSQT